jgi:hypothetical protein
MRLAPHRSAIRLFAAAKQHSIAAREGAWRANKYKNDRSKNVSHRLSHRRAMLRHSCSTVKCDFTALIRRSNDTIGGLIHILVAAIVLVLIRIIQGRRPI